MKNYLILAMALLFTVASVNGQSKKKQQEPEGPADESYQVVNVTKEASVCYDTLTKAYDLVCFVNQGNTQKTVNVKLGVTWDEVAASLHKAMNEKGIKFQTIAKVIRYLVMDRRMPAGNYVMTLDYCTPYALKLNINLTDYDFEKIPLTFALDDPKGEQTLKDRVNFSGELTKNDIETIRGFINEEFITNDVEAGFFIRIIDGPEPEVVAAPEKQEKGKDNKSKEEKTKKKPRR